MLSGVVRHSGNGQLDCEASSSCHIIRCVGIFEIPDIAVSLKKKILIGKIGRPFSTREWCGAYKRAECSLNCYAEMLAVEVLNLKAFVS